MNARTWNDVVKAITEDAIDGYKENVSEWGDTPREAYDWIIQSYTDDVRRSLEDALAPLRIADEVERENAA
jgi:hypothetical protein